MSEVQSDIYLRPGYVVLFGSGETSASSSKTHEYIAKHLQEKLHIAILETPAGFQPNSALVAREVADFLAQRLQNYRPRIDVIPARKKNTPNSPDDLRLLEPLLDANWIFLGPGSPTYACKQLENSLAYFILVARHRLGAVIMLASAGTLAFSAQVLPVYEIYKAGDELHWKKGLDFFEAYGLRLVFIPHWNNTDGGVKLDTSRCFMGKERFDRLIQLLPPGHTIVGLDEHTALIMDLAEGHCKIMGRGGVTVLRGAQEQRFESDSNFPISILGEFKMPEPEEGLLPSIWQMVREHQRLSKRRDEQIPDEVQVLVAERQRARQLKNWELSDHLRDQIAALGWEVRDTRQGVELVRKQKES